MVWRIETEQKVSFAAYLPLSITLPTPLPANRPQTAITSPPPRPLARPTSTNTKPAAVEAHSEHDYRIAIAADDGAVQVWDSTLTRVLSRLAMVVEPVSLVFVDP